jgi:hypothetical protein
VSHVPRRSTLAAAAAASAFAVGAIAAFPAPTSSTAPAPTPQSLTQAHAIGAQVGARYQHLSSGGLAVSEASSTGVLESFTLLTPDLLHKRVLPASNGFWYAICPSGATCPYPARRLARQPSDLVSRRMALELALHTFLKTSAEVVAVSLPTTRFTAFIVERRELNREINLTRLAKALGGEASRALAPSLARVVDRLTRPRVFLWLGLEPTTNGRDSWAGIPCWPGGLY